MLLFLVGNPFPQSARAEDPAIPKVTQHGRDEVVALHHKITLSCDNLSAWAKTSDTSKLILYLDGIAMKGLVPRLGELGSNRVAFPLERIATNKDNIDAWNTLLSRPTRVGESENEIPVTIGLDGHPFESGATVQLIAIGTASFLVFAVLFAFLLIGIIWLGWKSDLLRDSGDQPAGGRKTFSLARTQMAFWFFIVVAAYAFIWIVTGATDTLSNSVLALIGISAATGLAGAVVDNSKKAQARADLANLLAEEAKLQKDQTPTGVAANAPRLADLTGLIANARTALQSCTSKGFFNDILNDGDGVSVHRLQIAVWTVVLGIIFGFSVYYALVMPSFSDQLLALMGISSGTYIGFKFPESL